MTVKNKINFKIEQKEFISDYLYKKPYLSRGAINCHDILWSEINEIYERADAYDRSFKLMNGYEVPKKEYIESYINVGKIEYRYVKSAIYRYMREGATLVYNRIQNEPFVSHIARQISQFVNAQVITSGYAAFSAKPSYRCHWDTRDVFAVQIKGRKRWVLKKPNFELPLYMQQVKDMQGIKEPEEIYLDIVLEAGDILYVPRGWWHNPIPMDGETFHLAIGTFAPTGFDYLNWLIQFAPNIMEGRRNLHNFEDSRASLVCFGDQFGELLSNRELFERFMADYIGQQRVDSKISLEKLGNNKFHKLEYSQAIILNANLIYHFSDGFLILNGNKINIDSIGVKLINYIIKNKQCKVGDIIFEFSDFPAIKLQELLFQLALNDVIELQD